jgi:hypothetical protein
MHLAVNSDITSLFILAFAHSDSAFLAWAMLGEIACRSQFGRSRRCQNHVAVAGQVKALLYLSTEGS